MSTLDILDVKPLSDVSLMSIFSHLVDYLFVLLKDSFTVQKLFTVR